MSVLGLRGVFGLVIAEPSATNALGTMRTLCPDAGCLRLKANVAQLSSSRQAKLDVLAPASHPFLRLNLVARWATRIPARDCASARWLMTVAHALLVKLALSAVRFD
jgi:hypothetical protein